MQPGYPIVIDHSIIPRLLDLKGLQSRGDWGLFHQLGHSFQHAAWTPVGFEEVCAERIQVDTLTHDVDHLQLFCFVPIRGLLRKKVQGHSSLHGSLQDCYRQTPNDQAWYYSS